MIKHKRCMILSFLVLTMTLVSLNPLEALAAEKPAFSDRIFDTTITFANYTDWDNDLCEDDIYFYLDIDFTCFKPTEKYWMYIYATLELPSGTVLAGSVTIFLPAIDTAITLYSLDVATEAGWYTLTTASSFCAARGKVYSSISQYIFDPPTGKGNGLAS
ncbi:MAG: hypothetical protein ACFFD4_04930 [Candidatus Odinarchaeota archaeon]